jgi:GNAT superfamily N-acetyltransferase
MSTDVLRLRDGLEVAFAEACADDEAAILEFLSQLSGQSLRRRFFSAAINLRAETHRELIDERADHHGLLAWSGDRGVVGHAIYVRLGRQTRAEVAVEVADDLHHRGLATQLIIRLARRAEAHGITRFFAEVLPENHDMLAVFRDAFATVSVAGRDTIEIEFPTSGWRAADTRFQSARSR